MGCKGETDTTRVHTHEHEHEHKHEHAHKHARVKKTAYHVSKVYVQFQISGLTWRPLSSV